MQFVDKVRGEILHKGKYAGGRELFTFERYEGENYEGRLFTITFHFRAFFSLSFSLFFSLSLNQTTQQYSRLFSYHGAACTVPANK